MAHTCNNIYDDTCVSAAPILPARRRMLQCLVAACGSALCGSAAARSLDYELQAVEVASRTWMVLGRSEYFSLDNGGNIVNVAFVEVPEGVVVIDTGPSLRYGTALRQLIEKTVPGKSVLRVYNTHHHPDHFLGNQAFDASHIAAPQQVIDNIASEGDGFTNNLYRLLGDWMRGTQVVSPQVTLMGEKETVGGRDFSFLYLSGHTNSDLVIRDEQTGVLFAGDLAFLYRAPTTPHADIQVWQESLRRLESTDRALLIPGHGPTDSSNESLRQTADYLSWLQGTLEIAVNRGLTMNEAMNLPIPARFAGLGVVRSEFQRSVVHLYPGMEDSIFSVIEVDR